MQSSERNWPVICFGEILWDELPDNKVPGGAPMNVAYHLKKLGLNPALITKVGHDDDGKQLIELMEKKGISTDYFQMDFALMTGLAKAKIGLNNEVSYDLIKPAAWDNILWEDDFVSLFGGAPSGAASGAPYFVFGSLAARSEASRNTLYRLLELADKRVLDINLRPPHYTRPVIEHLLKAVELLKVNVSELELITGWFSDYKDDKDRLRVLQDKFHTPNIIVTRGSEGALFSAGGVLYEHPGFTIKLADTIGSGDAFLAGTIAGLCRGEPPDRVLEYACAIGALVASRTGPCPEYELKEITQMFKL